MLSFRFGFLDRAARSHAIVGCFASILAVLAFAIPPTSSAATLSKVSCGNSTFNAAGTDACSVYLTAKAGAKYYVTLQSNNPAVVVPGGVTVKAGAMTTGFNAMVSAVTVSQVATITALSGGVSRTFSISLSPSNGSGTAALSVNATTIAFGSVALNTQVAQPVTLTSTGSAAVTVNSVQVSGSGFSVSGATLPVTLNPGQSLTLEVGFDPTVIASFTGQLTIGTSASTKTIALSGTGISATAAHQVQLSWLAPANSADPVAGYNVYRAANGSSTYALLNAAIECQLAFTDGNVVSGSTYTYMVKSVDAQGVESPASNATSVTIP